MSLQSLGELKIQLGISGTADDALLEELQAAADQFITRHCQRDFSGGPFTEFHRGGTKMLFLRNFPISSVVSVQVDSTRVFGPESTVDSSEYVVLAEAGLIESLGDCFLRAKTPNAIKVVYSTPAGVPADVLRAEAELVSHWFRQAKTHTATEQLNLLAQSAEGEAREFPWGQSGGFRIPNSVLQLLHSYRVPSLG